MLNRVEILRAVCVGRGMCANTHTLDPVFRILLVSRTVGTVIDAGTKVIVRQIGEDHQEGITATVDVDGTRVEDQVRLDVAAAEVTIDRQMDFRSDRPISRRKRMSTVIGVRSCSLRSTRDWTTRRPVSAQSFYHPRMKVL